MDNDDWNLRSAGNITRDDCIKHIHVEWDCDCGLLLNFHVLSIESPVFSVGNQTYALNFHKSSRGIDFDLYFNLSRKGSSVDVPCVRWWAGLKRSNGTYHYRNRFGVQSFDDFQQLLEIRETDFRREHLATNHHFTFVFQMNVASTSSEPCRHGTAEISVPSQGNITRNECTSHKRVEWDVEGRWLYAVSPVFQIANQHYFLEFSSEFDVQVCLYRMGQSVDGPSRSVRWWAGLKHGDGTFSHENRFGVLELDEEVLMWTNVECLQSYSTDAFRAYFERICHGFTAIFQINVEQESATDETCTHGIPGKSPSFIGTLTKDECSSHKRVEWNLRTLKAVSPVFQIGNQRYLLQIKALQNASGYYAGSSLHLLRMGPSVHGSVRWWAGLKRDDGTYLRWNAFGDLDLKVEFSMFAEAECLLNTEDNRDSAEAIFPVEYGEIRVDGFTCHIKVEWTSNYYGGRLGIRTSPVFCYGEQRYRFVLIMLSYNTDFYLYRLGPSTDSTQRIEFSAGLKRDDGTDHHKNETGALLLDKSCELWSHEKVLASFEDYYFKKHHVSKEGRFIFVFQMNNMTGEKCSHDSGTVEQSRWNHGEIEPKICSSHMHVEWRDIDCLQLLDGSESRWISPVFSIEQQSYALSLSQYYNRYDHQYHLELLRKGSSVTGQPLRWTAGIKFKDDTYDYRNTSGKLKLQEKLSELREVKRLLTLTEEELHEYHLTSGRINAFFQLEVEHPSAEACTHGTQEISRPFRGELTHVRDECTSHKRLEWHVGSVYGIPFSEVFQIANQSYMLELSFLFDDVFHDVVLRLYRKGSSRAVGDPVRSLQWWTGLKRSDGTHSISNRCVDLKQEEAFSMWTAVEQFTYIFSDDLKERYIKRNDVTVVLQVNVGEESTRAETYNHDFRWMTPPSDGSITQEVCTSHMRVDWIVDWNEDERKTWAVSPVFEIRNQRYLLEFKKEDRITLNLYRMGPSLNHSTGPIRWWAGLRRRDGTYHHTNESGNLNEGVECWMWAKAEELLSIGKDTFRLYRRKFHGFAAFFQMNVEVASTTRKECKHDSARAIFPPPDGNLLIQICQSHQHMEWVLHYDPEDEDKIWTSSDFGIRNQSYRFVFSKIDSEGTFRLYRLGHSVDDLGTPVQWWAGLKQSDGSYQNRNSSGELLTQENCELWSEVARLTTVLLENLPKYHLDKENRITFFFWTNCMTGLETCNHDRSDLFPLNVGSIVEEKWTSYRLLHWNVDFDRKNDVNEDMASPVFEFDKQSYLLELVFSGTRKVSLRLCRMGPATDRSVQWWAGSRCRDGTFQEYGSSKGTLKLQAEYPLWTHEDELHSFGLREVKRMNLTVNVLMTLEKSPPGGEECVTVGDQAGQDFDHLYEDDIVFRVKGEEIKATKAFIRFEAPVLGALFQHDNVESRSGEVKIDDCEPAAFGEFLELIKDGFRKTPTVENAFELYCLANKYVLGNLKKKCLKTIRHSYSLDTFCKIARICFQYQDRDLLKTLIRFLSRHMEITNSDSFLKLRSEHPEDVEGLLAKASTPAN